VAWFPDIAWWYWAATIERAYLTPAIQGCILAALVQPD